MARSLYGFLFSALFFVAFPGPAHAGLDVVATVPDLAALARAVGGDKVSVKSLSLATQDPHWVDAKPSLTLDVNRADMLLAVGLDLESGWLPALQKGARNPKVQRGGAGFLECAAVVERLEVPQGQVDRSMGDIHPGGNPHYLYDPRAALACARAIAAKMVALDPGNATVYQANLAAFAAALDKRRAEWERRLAPHRGAPVIVYHRSWAYLISWLGLREVAAIEPKPGVSPSPRHVAQVIQQTKNSRAKVLLQEAYYPNKTGMLVAQKSGARLVSVPGGADFRAGQSYIDHMDQVVNLLAKALGE